MTSELAGEVWVYAGRREIAGGALAGAWIDVTGEELLFKGKHRAIGATYEVQVGRDANTVRAGVDRATFVQGAGDDPRIPGWMAIDRAAYTSHQARRPRGARQARRRAALRGADAQRRARPPRGARGARARRVAGQRLAAPSSMTRPNTTPATLPLSARSARARPPSAPGSPPGDITLSPGELRR